MVKHDFKWNKRMKVVFVNGTFDVLHRGHIDLLTYAKSLGDCLFVAIDTDERVRSLKGPGRPIMNQSDRFAMLLALRSVDGVFWFESDDQLEKLIKHAKVDIMVKGSDWKDKPIIGSKYAKNIVFFDRLPYSTTDVIQKIQSLSKE